MEKYISTIVNHQEQYLLYFGLSGVIAIMTGALYARNAPAFQLLLGRLNPFVAISIVIVSGFLLLTFLLSREWFTFYKAGNARGMLFASIMAAIFGVAIILVDLKAVFPADTNQAFPDSLFYYPFFGFVVEVVFHMLPISLLLLALTSLFSGLDYEKAIWPCILITAFIEPIFQTVLGSSRPYPLWLVVYVFFHILGINFVELVIFKRYDFISMFSFRLVYYAIWHIVWGHMRLSILF